MAELSIAIVGGGIGGLSAALTLLRAGFDVHVYEQAGELRELGAGIQISPNASRLLRELGLGDTLESLGVKPVGRRVRRWQDGRTLQHSVLAAAMEAQFGSPYYQMHRADLLQALVDALPKDRMHKGHRLAGFVDHGDRVELQFENGEAARAGVLVGADGIHSTVRSILFGPEKPRFTGCMCYRGLVPAEKLKHLAVPREATTWWGPGGHFVHYYVRAAKLLNFVAVRDHDAWTTESWTERGEVADAIAAFAGWHPQLRGILECVEETFTWGLFDRLPLQRWSAGRVTLLGDACHAMLPFMAQGAAQSIEDGAALAACLLADRDNIAAALRRYEKERLPRATRVQALAAGNKTRLHLPDGPEQLARDAELANGTAQFALQDNAWLYGHDATKLSDP
jgi:salicylate hydroxylase